MFGGHGSIIDESTRHLTTVSDMSKSFKQKKQLRFAIDETESSAAIRTDDLRSRQDLVSIQSSFTHSASPEHRSSLKKPSPQRVTHKSHNTIASNPILIQHAKPSAYK